MSTAVTAAARVRRAAIDVVDVSDNVTTYPVRTEHVQYEYVQYEHAVQNVHM